MKSLDGDGSFKILDGTISGIDVTEFLTGIEQTFRARSLPGGIGANEITRFKDIISGFTLSDGVASVKDFKIEGPGFIAEGRGQVDLGNQTLDFRLRPRVTRSDAGGLANFGIPLRFSGPFNGARPSLDQDFLAEIIEARARAEVQDLIRDNIGGTAGDILGQIIGGGQRRPTSTEPETPAQDTNTSNDGSAPAIVPQAPSQETEPTVTGSETDDAAEPTDNADEETDNDRSDEEVVIDTLRDLFGRRQTETDNN